MTDALLLGEVILKVNHGLFSMHIPKLLNVELQTSDENLFLAENLFRPDFMFHNTMNKSLKISSVTKEVIL